MVFCYPFSLHHRVASFANAQKLQVTITAVPGSCSCTCTWPACWALGSRFLPIPSSMCACTAPPRGHAVLPAPCSSAGLSGRSLPFHNTRSRRKTGNVEMGNGG
ncbi:unnamed protein product [Periconia digitata]|uniref:Uncharacterized protein n=1 Tax=Periconia digitata TaxID=1303443 RepID=A0A9W4U4N8_9PLEO|nr:unnamed protein product [Periconia digitata]